MRFTALYPMHQTPYSRDIIDAQFVLDFARTAEKCGYDALALTEHPAPSARWLEAGGHDALDVFTALGYFAAVTTRVQLMPYVLVPPFRNPVMAAKQIATLDVLSGGRAVIPVGTGYLRSEARALGSVFEQRNELLDQSILVWKHMWAGDPATVEGEGYHAEAILQRPRPVQDPHPPIWVGGNSARARQRVAEYGDGWTPMLADDVIARTTRTAPLPDIPTLSRAIQDLHQRLETAGRDPSTIAVQLQQLRGPVRGLELERNYPAYCESLAELEAVGVTQVLVHIPSDNGQRGLDTLESFAEGVIDQYR
jgi:probable F420-dependent oxidoreductase